MIPDLAQWDVVRVRIRPGDKDLHPAVVISRADICRDERKQSINVVYGSVTHERRRALSRTLHRAFALLS